MNNFINSINTILIHIHNNLISWIVIFLIIKNYGLESCYYFFLIASINAILITIKEFGTEEYILLISSNVKIKSLTIIRSLFCFNFFISSFLYFLILIILYLFDKNLFNHFIILGLNSIFLVSTVINYLIGSKEIQKPTIIINIIFVIFLILFFILKYQSIFSIYKIYTLYNFIIFFYYIILIKKLKFRLSYLKILIKKKYIILLSNITNLMTGRGSLIILDLFLSNYNISIFGFITRIIESGVMISNYVIKYFMYTIIKDTKKKDWLNNYFTYLFITIILIIFLIYLYFLDTKNIYLSLTSLTILLTFSLYLCIISIIENIVKFRNIDLRLNYLHFKNVYLSSFIKISFILTFLYFYELKGALIAYFLNYHIYYFLSIIFLKNKNDKNSTRN